MNKRLLMVVLAVPVLMTAGGCAPFRTFFFGRGARCGLCTKFAKPFRNQVPVAATPVPTCNPPVYQQPVCGTPYAVASPGCGCNTTNVDPCMNGTAYGSPGSYGPSYDSGIIGNGVDNFGPRYSSGYESYSPGYAVPGYKVDEKGDRIIYEEQLPAGTVRAGQ